jgi:hypothetical protein
MRLWRGRPTGAERKPMPLLELPGFAEFRDFVGLLNDLFMKTVPRLRGLRGIGSTKGSGDETLPTNAGTVGENV